MGCAFVILHPVEEIWALLYDEGAQKRIVRIRLYQQFGFRVKEIVDLIDAPGEVRKAALETQIVHLRQKEKQFIVGFMN